jgi:sugar (pentulose or hexulose) kinase
MLALGIDIGTSGVRTAVLDGDVVFSSASVPHPAQSGRDIDANLWWDAVSDCLHAQARALKDVGRDMADIGAIAVDGTSGSMVLTDADLTPVSPALMYNSKGFDKEAARIANHVGTDHITSGPNSALARAMRLVSDATSAPVHLMYQADFIAAKLIRRGGHSDFNNALKTGFDPATQAWPNWVGDVIDVTLLPEIHSPGAPINTVSRDMVTTFGLSKSAVVHAGTTDSIAAFLACASLVEGVAVTSLGSTLAVKMLSESRIDDPSIGLYSHKLGDLWLVGGASNTGGAVLKAHFDADQIADLSSQIDPTLSLGLDYYPLLECGERFPVNDPTLQPKMTPRPASDVEFLHGLLEGIADIEATCYREIVRRGGVWPTVIYTAGGGSRNDVWSLMRAEKLGITVEKAVHSEASIGAARLAQNKFWRYYT